MLSDGALCCAHVRLIKYDTFSEDVTKFYMAECILAIEAVHNLGFIHRCAQRSAPAITS